MLPLCVGVVKVVIMNFSMNAIDDGQNYLILRTVPRTKLTKSQQEDISVKCKPSACRKKYGLHGGGGGMGGLSPSEQV